MSARRSTVIHGPGSALLPARSDVRTFALLACLLAGCGATPATPDACNQDFRKLTDDYVALQRTCGGDDAVLRRVTNEDLEALLNELGLEHTQFQKNGYVVKAHDIKHVLVNHGRNLQFWVGFTAQPQPGVINEWNKRRRFSRAYLDDEGNAVLESDMDLEGGVTTGAIREFLKTFLVSVENYAGFVSRTLPPPPEST